MASVLDVDVGWLMGIDMPPLSQPTPSENSDSNNSSMSIMDNSIPPFSSFHKDVLRYINHEEDNHYVVSPFSSIKFRIQDYDPNRDTLAVWIPYLNETTGKKVQKKHYDTHDAILIPEAWIGLRPTEEYFALHIHGDSMYPKYCEKDDVLCFFDSNLTKSGAVYVIHKHGETFLRKLEFPTDKEWIDLVPLNPEYTTKHFEGSDLKQIRIIGRVIKLIRAIDEM